MNQLLEACKFAAEVIADYLLEDPEKTDPEMSEAYRRLTEAIEEFPEGKTHHELKVS